MSRDEEGLSRRIFIGPILLIAIAIVLPVPLAQADTAVDIESTATNSADGVDDGVADTTSDPTGTIQTASGAASEDVSSPISVAADEPGFRCLDYRHRCHDGRRRRGHRVDIRSWERSALCERRRGRILPGRRKHKAPCRRRQGPGGVRGYRARLRSSAERSSERGRDNLRGHTSSFHDDERRRGFDTDRVRNRERGVGCGDCP